ncbi:hypothetical protein FQR65_LT06993 [Abscondita terminalis]|nr:hypothetical protein FQR65_LT06993 [Abscondita terminalis]
MLGYVLYHQFQDMGVTPQWADECGIDVISGESEISNGDPTFFNESDISISESEDTSEEEANAVPEVASGEMISSNT